MPCWTASGYSRDGAFDPITKLPPKIPIRMSASTTPRGRWIYGAGIGALVYIIRSWGGYPDGIAFAVVLMNIAAPLIDYYTQPKVYGDPDK